MLWFVVLALVLTASLWGSYITWYIVHDIKKDITVEKLHDVNIAFKYEGDIGTTINCSQLIMWAETYGLQQHYDLKEAIMSAYHEQAKNIALPEVMLDCVRQVDGLKEHVEEAEMVLQTDAFKKAVADQIIDAQQKLNVNGVPHFFITAVNGDVARSFNFPGAQDTRFFTNALSKLNAIVHETDASKL